MNLFDVYPLFDVNIVKGKGCHVWDDKGQEYLDLYGGHAVISIGHARPRYIQAITEQVQQLGFYSNSVVNKLQQQLALGNRVLQHRQQCLRGGQGLLGIGAGHGDQVTHIRRAQRVS